MPVHRLRPTSPTGALTSVSSRLRTVSPTGRPSKALPLTPTPRLRPGYAKTLLAALLRLAQPEPTGTNRPGTPAQKGPENERKKQGKALKSNHDTRDHTLSPAGTVLCNHPDTNSIVGADIFLYSIVGVVNSHIVRPPHASRHR